MPGDTLLLRWGRAARHRTRGSRLVPASTRASGVWCVTALYRGGRASALSVAEQPELRASFEKHSGSVYLLLVFNYWPWRPLNSCWKIARLPGLGLAPSPGLYSATGKVPAPIPALLPTHGIGAPKSESSRRAGRRSWTRARQRLSPWGAGRAVLVLCRI